MSDDETRLQLVIPGATPEQLAAGLEVARAALAIGKVDPAAGFRANVARTAWRREEGPALSEVDADLAAIFGVAEIAAIDAVIGLDVLRPEGTRLFVGARLH